jgi:hypothetical protein
MDAKTINKFLKKFKWNNLCNMYGSSHCSIIGFISAGWIDQSLHNTVMDGAPSPIRGRGRNGQKNADSILFKQKKPYIVVEVESWNYRNKIDTIQKYMKNKKYFSSVAFGLLVMTNVYGLRKNEGCWDVIKDKVKEMKDSIALVFLEKEDAKLDASSLDRLRALDENKYSSKIISRINYWIHTASQDVYGTLH